MKKSNKLLLLTGITPLIVMSLVHLNLYARYRSSHIVTEAQAHAEQWERKELPAPACLSITGVSSVTIISSDSFAIEYYKEWVKRIGLTIPEDMQLISGPPHLRYSRRGDTLEIVGWDTLKSRINPADSQELKHFAGITVYCKAIPTLVFDGCGVVIEQQENRTVLAPATRLVLHTSAFVLGSDNDTLAHYPYGALTVTSVNSTLTLNPNAVIQDLRLDMDSSSIFNDFGAKVGRLGIRCTDRSRLQLSGKNMQQVDWGKP